MGIVKKRTIHQKNVQTVPMPPTDHKKRTCIHHGHQRKPLSEHIYTRCTNINIEKPFKLTRPQLHWADAALTRCYIILGPPKTYYVTQEITCDGHSSIDWQQHMGRAKFIRYDKMHKHLAQNQTHYTQDFDHTFRPLPQIAYLDKNYADPQYGLDPYWEDNIYDQEILDYCCNYNKPVEQIEGDDINTETHKSHKLRYGLIDLSTIILQLPGTSSLPHSTPFIHPSKPRQQLVIGNEIALQLKSVHN